MYALRELRIRKTVNESSIWPLDPVGSGCLTIRASVRRSHGGNLRLVRGGQCAPKLDAKFKERLPRSALAKGGQGAQPCRPDESEISSDAGQVAAPLAS